MKFSIVLYDHLNKVITIRKNKKKNKNVFYSTMKFSKVPYDHLNKVISIRKQNRKYCFFLLHF